MKSLAVWMAAGVATLATAVGTGGCGAKTGLRVPDVVTVPDVTDVTMCMPGRFTLEPRSTQILFLIDRSNSMNEGLDGRPDVPRPLWRWTALRNALSTALLPFENTVEMGALFFPREELGSLPGLESACTIMPGEGIDVEPRLRNTGSILSVLDRTDPWGGTPTYEAIRRARNYLLSHPSRGRSANIVLATDGGPNCNERLNPATCACTSVDARGPTCSRTPSGVYNCLDDMRTLLAVDATVAGGVPVYVIGIDDPMRPDLTEVLNRLAVRGGRPNSQPGEPRYYSVRSSEALTAAFTSIQRSITQCAFVTPSRPDDPDEIEIEIDGVPVPRDETHRDGWDWTDPDFGAISFFGPSCDRAAGTTTAVTARVGCRDGG
jgi:hypothetical protein